MVPHLQQAARFFTEVLDGSVLGQTEALWPEMARWVDVGVADLVVRLLSPDEPAGSPLGEYLAGPHSGVYALGWEVGDVDAGAALIQGLGLAVEPVDASDAAYELRAVGARHWLCRT